MSALIFLCGASLLIWSEVSDTAKSTLWLKSVSSNLGALLIASVSIAILWELFSKRAFLDELLAKTGLAEEIKKIGLIGMALSPVRGPDFPKLIKSAERLDIFVCYANTWRANFQDDLKTLARKKNCRIRLIVPNPENLDLMRELSKRFGSAGAEQMKEKIGGAIDEYKSLFLSANNSTLDFSVWVHDTSPLASFYRFEKVAVLTLYKHAPGRGATPTLIVERDGELYSFIENEVDAMIKGTGSHPALAKKIFPPEEAQA